MMIEVSSPPEYASTTFFTLRFTFAIGLSFSSLLPVQSYSLESAPSGPGTPRLET